MWSCDDDERINVNFHADANIRGKLGVKLRKERPQVSMIILIRDLHLFAIRNDDNEMISWVSATISC